MLPDIAVIRHPWASCANRGKTVGSEVFRPYRTLRSIRHVSDEKTVTDPHCVMSPAESLCKGHCTLVINLKALNLCK